MRRSIWEEVDDTTIKLFVKNKERRGKSIDKYLVSIQPQSLRNITILPGTQRVRYCIKLFEINLLKVKFRISS